MDAAERTGAAALVAVLFLAATLAGQPLSHDDLFLHLAAGEHMLTAGTVLTTDPFSYTRTGARWVTHEWGFSVLVAIGERLGGLASLVAVRVVLVVTFFALVAAAAWRRAGAARRGASPVLALLLGLAAWAGSPELILRAALAGAVLFAAAFVLLGRFREAPTLARGAALAALFLVWANLHSGVVFGLFLVALGALEALVLPPSPTALRTRLTSAVPHLALALGAGAAALLNPNGFDALAYPFRLARLLSDPASGFTVGHFAGGWHGRSALLGLLLAVLLAGLLAARRRGGRLPPPWEVAAALVLGALSWRTGRVALELVAVAVPTSFALWAPAVRPQNGPAPARPRRGLTAAGVVLVLGALLVSAAVVAARPPGVIAPHFPAGAAAFLEREVLPHATGTDRVRLFHHQNWGGYLHWRLGVPVFWDGRNDVFAPLVREVVDTPFTVLVERYGIDVLLLSPREVRDLLPLLRGPRWALVYLDGRSAAFLRRDVWGERAAELALPPRSASGPGARLR